MRLKPLDEFLAVFKYKRMFLVIKLRIPG